MDIGLLVVVTIAVMLLVLAALPRVRAAVGLTPAPVERRRGVDRRRETLPVPFERRRRVRRADDVDRELSDLLG